MNIGHPAISVLLLVVPYLRTSAQPVPTVVDTAPLVTSTHAPVFTAVNPPSCAQEFADATKHITYGAVDIVYATSTCAENMGWYGNTPDGNKQTFPFHNGRSCASNLVDNFANFAAVVGDLEGAAFDCFNHNQACGQSIAKAAQCIFEGTTSLISAAANCEPPGGNPPYVDAGYDVPAKGFFCWQNIAHFGQRLLKTSKYIDVALLTCETTPPSPTGGAGAAPTPEGANSTAGSGTPPQPVTDGATNSSGSPPPPTPDDSTDSSVDSASLGASWGSLQQPEPFKMVGQGAETGPVERRLSMAATPASAGAKAMIERLDAARARIAGFLDAFGVDNTTAAEYWKEWSADELEEIAPLVQEFRKAFTASRVADPTTPIAV